MSIEPSSPPESHERTLPKALRTFQSLVVPQYRNYFTAMFFYFAAMQMMVLLRPYLAYDLSADAAGNRSEMALGITIAANSLPSLVLSPFAGALADRFSMRIILQVCALLMAASAVLLAYGITTGLFTWWHVALVGLFQGCVMTFITPTRRAVVSELVPKHYLLNAVSLHTVTQNVNRTIMPATAGFIYEVFSPSLSVLVVAGLYMTALVLLFTVPAVKKELAKKGSMAGAIGDGIKYAAREPIIRNLLLIGLVVSIFGQPIQHLLPMFDGVLNIGPTQVGLLLTFMGIGSLLGSVTSASLGDFKRKGLLLVGFFTMLGLAIVAFSASSIYVLSLLLMVPVGMGHSGRIAVHLATLQSYSEPSMRGRVQALNAMQGGLMPIAVLGVTFLAESIGPQLAMGLSGAVILVYGLWEMLFSRTIRDLR